jgi:hypothetical protein
VLENREIGEVIGNPAAPFLNSLRRRGALALRYFAVSHPSLPNYLALLGGSTFGIDSNCSGCAARGPSLALQLARRGVPWRAYMEGLPHACFRGEDAGAYVRRHDPFMYFPSIASSRRRCADIVSFVRLHADLQRGTVPRFAWVQPGLCHGGHDCGIHTVDRHLRRLVPKLERALAPRGFLVLTFDEGTSDRGCCGSAGGGRVATILLGPRVRRGARLRGPHDHFSLLATIEDAFGLPRLRRAQGARPLDAGFEPERPPAR